MKKLIFTLALIALIALISIAATLNADDAPAVGSTAPAFNLQDQNGDWHKLEDFRGTWLAVYFYPKNDTPGCTTEACNFRDNIYAFKAIGASVVGISVDDVDSHKEFSDKYKLPFTILADENGETARSYGVLRDWKLVKIASRQSFLVNPEGVIAKHYEDVDPDTHTMQVLADLEKLMDATG
ncbi:MAG: peroxiredoxin [Xanthomonadales bacterium]|nr:peroxiredoxin [Gammaproteobacteria bacterium]MBT8054338.1 peroxiredoxin [Gammaproteobacteria bacterium]NND57469.1 peroxiredoxin [Xanthomonadales bacterium]NNK51193.1 peroxiredoxin [Xanthomonadales bacterium]